MVAKFATDIVTQSVINLLTDITPDKLHQTLDQTVANFKTHGDVIFDKEFLFVVNE